MSDFDLLLKYTRWKLDLFSDLASKQYQFTQAFYHQAHFKSHHILLAVELRLDS